MEIGIMRINMKFQEENVERDKIVYDKFLMNVKFYC